MDMKPKCKVSGGSFDISHYIILNNILLHPEMEDFTKKTLEDVYNNGDDECNLGIFLGLTRMESSPMEIHGCPVDVPFMC